MDNLLDEFLRTIEVDESIDLTNMVNGRYCRRECHKNDTKICHFHFALKYYQIMGGYVMNIMKELCNSYQFCLGHVKIVP